MDAEKVALVASNDVIGEERITPVGEVVEASDDGALARDPVKQKKIQDILQACDRKDVAQLRELADAAGGFLSDEVRRRAWPVLLGLTTNSAAGLSEKEQDAAGEKVTSWRDLPSHRDEGQVDLDVKRSFVYYPQDQSDGELERTRADLSSLITQVLRHYPYLCYFQGYHDICQVFLLALGPEASAPAVSRLSVLRIRDFMLPTLDASMAQLNLLPDIIRQASPKLWRHLEGVKPFYALSGTLTMFAHNIERYHAIARLFDVLLAREPAFSLYLFAQIVIDRQDEILEIDEPDMLHVILGKVPSNMDLDQLIIDSVALFNRFPPQKLPAWRSISSASVLKTAQDVDHNAEQSMASGQVYFEQQAKEIRWQEMRGKALKALWAYRRPAGTLGMTLAVGLVAFYLRRNPTVLNYVFTLLAR